MGETGSNGVKLTQMGVWVIPTLKAYVNYRQSILQVHVPGDPERGGDMGFTVECTEDETHIRVWNPYRRTLETVYRNQAKEATKEVAPLP